MATPAEFFNSKFFYSMFFFNGFIEILQDDIPLFVLTTYELKDTKRKETFSF